MAFRWRMVDPRFVRQYIEARCKRNNILGKLCDHFSRWCTIIYVVVDGILIFWGLDYTWPRTTTSVFIGVCWDNDHRERSQRGSFTIALNYLFGLCHIVFVGLMANKVLWVRPLQFHLRIFFVILWKIVSNTWVFFLLYTFVVFRVSIQYKNSSWRWSGELSSEPNAFFFVRNLAILLYHEYYIFRKIDVIWHFLYVYIEDKAAVLKKSWFSIFADFFFSSIL